MTQPQADDTGDASPVSGQSPLNASASASTETTRSNAEGEAGNRRKSQKVSRACDYCKIKKLRCSGTIPCTVCTRRHLSCQYDASYRRGRPPTPPASTPASTREDIRQEPEPRAKHVPSRQGRKRRPAAAPVTVTPARPGESSGVNAGLVSRASPELETAEIDGQFFDPTSNLTFLHRAWKRFSLQKGANVPADVMNGVVPSQQPLIAAGDRPLLTSPGQAFQMPDRQVASDLFDFYFDQCVVTYRCLHQYQTREWLHGVLANNENELPLHQDIGHAKASLVLNILAIASLRQSKISTHLYGQVDTYSSASDQYFSAATTLAGGETGLPRLESVQTRILQVLYLLQTGRMNQAWYTFGSTVPLVTALGLHRKSGRSRNGSSRTPSGDYIVSQCRRRTFWVVYTIDKYLGVVFGRPRLFHDDDIDQAYPDRVNDEDMGTEGALPSEPSMDCHIDSLICHAKVAGIVDNICREVYSLKPMRKQKRLTAAKEFVAKLHAWREELPPHLGTIRPKSLIPAFRRQAMALRLAYCHAIMHANRPFLMGNDQESDTVSLDESISDCIKAARMALETVDNMLADGSLFYAFWWTPYTTFCALSVVYVWEIQQRARGGNVSEDPSLFELAERCQGHLAKAASADSPGGRYHIIIEELRLEAKQGGSMGTSRNLFTSQPGGDMVGPEDLSMDLTMFQDHGPTGLIGGVPNLLTEWQATDWLDLDSSAFGPFPDFDSSPVVWDF